MLNEKPHQAFLLVYLLKTVPGFGIRSFSQHIYFF